MTDLHKNPILYYMLIPLLVGLWPLLMWFKYLPRAQADLVQQKTDILDANGLITKILNMDPDRLDYAKTAQGQTAEFSYGDVMNQVAKACGIPTPSLSEDRKTLKSQAANVDLDSVDIVKCANFLSTLQLRWDDLECTEVHLTEKKGLKDRWDVKLRFIYYF